MAPRGPRQALRWLFVLLLAALAAALLGVDIFRFPKVAGGDLSLAILQTHMPVRDGTPEAPKELQHIASPTGTGSITSSETAATEAPLAPPGPPQAPSHRWWRKRVFNPFYWDFDAKSNMPRYARQFPCEETCDNVECAIHERIGRTRCRNLCGPSAVKDDCGMESCAPANASCTPVKCKPAIPHFHFIPSRSPYTLAHAATLLKRPKVRMLFLGDSTMKEIFLLARCHLGRCAPGVSASPVTRFMRFPTRIARVRDKQAAFALAFTASYSISEDAAQTPVHLDIMYLQNRYVAADDPEMLRMLCEEADVMMINWALWYHKAGPYYESVMQPALQVLANCQRENGTVVVYTNHASQHFNSPSGRYPPTQAKDLRCVPLVNASEDQDIWTQGLRANVLPQLGISLIPSPWEDLELASCPKVESAAKPRLHWIPYLDATQALGGFHKSKSGDCTHLDSYPEFGVPLFDGIFLAVLHETSLRQHTCERGPPAPKFFTVDATSTPLVHEQVLRNFGALGGYDTATDFNKEYIFALQKRLVPRAVDFSKESAALMKKYENATMEFGHGGG